MSLSGSNSKEICEFVKEVAEELHDVKLKWRVIGTQLLIPKSTLDRIEKERGSDTELAFMDMIHEWLSQLSGTDTISEYWCEILKALNSRSVSESKLAKNINIRKNDIAKWLLTTDEVESVGSDVEILPGYQPEISKEVCERIKQLSTQFNKLRLDTFRHIKTLLDNQEKVEDFKLFICNPEYLIIHVDHHKLCRAKSASKICLIISQRQYINWFNYTILAEIIQEYGNPELKAGLVLYSKEVDSFEEETDLTALKNLVFSPCPHGCKLIKVPATNTMKLNAIRKIGSTLKKRNGFTSPLHHVGEHSPLGIYFIVPRLFVPPNFKTGLVSETSDPIDKLVVMTYPSEWVIQLLDLQPHQLCTSVKPSYEAESSTTTTSKLKDTLDGAATDVYTDTVLQEDDMDLAGTAAKMSDRQPPDYRVFADELFDVRAKWYEFGIQLGVDYKTLNAIKKENRNITGAFHRMLKTWYDGTQTPSWVAVIRALQSRTVQEMVLASNLKERYRIPSPSEAAAQTQLAMEHVSFVRPPPAGMALPVVACPVDKDVQRDIDRLNQAFQDIYMDVYTHLDENTPNLKEFAIFVSLPFTSQKTKSSKQMSKVDLDAVMRPGTEFYQMYGIVGQYTTWYNYELLDNIIQRYGDPRLKGKMDVYRSALAEFESRTSAEKLKNVILGQPLADSDTIIAKLRHYHCNQFMASDVRMIKDQYAAGAGVSADKLRVNVISES